MRQRKTKNIEEKLRDYEKIVVRDPADLKGKWTKRFSRENSIYLEIGCGKGKFISSLSFFYPERNFVGIEGNQTVALRALDKISKMNLENISIVPEFIRSPEDWFAEDEVAGIYLNFSDPWPKERHTKRRLTSKNYLAAYQHILKPGGTLEIKTDNNVFFEFTLKTINEMGIEILEMTRDLHKSTLAAKNWITEYEENFSGRGLEINYLKAGV